MSGEARSSQPLVCAKKPLQPAVRSDGRRIDRSPGLGEDLERAPQLLLANLSGFFTRISALGYAKEDLGFLDGEIRLIEPGIVKAPGSHGRGGQYCHADSGPDHQATQPPLYHSFHEPMHNDLAGDSTGRILMPDSLW